MARAELKVHADGPDGLIISIVRDGDSWEFRADAARPAGLPGKRRHAGADRRSPQQAV
jgi:hypothetical protein